MAEVFNKTSLTVDVVPHLGADGRQLALVIGKVALDIDTSGRLSLARQQSPIEYLDLACADASQAGLAYPSDLVEGKPLCDVLLVPPERPDELTAMRDRTVEVRIGALRFGGAVGKRWPFGPLRRDDEARRGHAGTYDATWLRDRMPLLPFDFDSRFHQSAPVAQRAHLVGDEAVAVRGLYGERPLEFALPARCMVVSGNRGSDYFTEVARLDTFLLEASRPRLTLVWRHAIATRQKFAEVSNVFVYLPRLCSVRALYGRL